MKKERNTTVSSSSRGVLVTNNSVSFRENILSTYSIYASMQTLFHFAHKKIHSVIS